MSVYSGPAYPLDREQFCAALQKGLGRAIEHVRRFGVSGNEDLIIAACLTDQAYDPQTEGGRTKWIYELLRSGRHAAEAAAALLPALREAANHENDYAVEHRFALAGRLVEAGHSSLVDALKSASLASETPYEAVGAGALLQAFGAEGLLLMARKLGRLASASPAYSPEDLTTKYDEFVAAGAGRSLLESHRANDSDIAAYLDGLDRGRPRVRPPETKKSLGEIVEYIRAPRGGQFKWTPVWLWAKHATDEELNEIAGLLDTLDSSDSLVCAVAAFRQRAHAPALDALIRLADDANAEVRQHALTALSLHADPRVRLLFERGRGADVDSVLKLLAKNCEPGDAAFVLSVLMHESGAIDFHGRAMDVLDICDANSDPALADALFVVYERTPCSSCRRSAVELLRRRAKLPAWLEAEYQCDVNMVRDLEFPEEP